MKNKLKQIIDFREGQKIKGFFLCIEKHFRFTKKNDKYIDIILRDVTGHIPAKIWSDTKSLESKFDAGDAVAISGNVESYKGKLHLIIIKINKATVQYYGRYGFDPGLIVPKSKKDPQKMYRNIKSVISRINNKYFNNLVKTIFKKNEKKILFYPATVNMHYNYRSGFLEHLTSITEIGIRIYPLYALDKDLVLMGLLLHNIGAIKAINSHYQFDFTTEGRLIGSEVLGKELINRYVNKIHGFPSDLLIKLSHIILSTSNSKKKSNTGPSFPEALLINAIVELDLKIFMMKSTIDADKDVGSFTNVYNIFGLPLLKKDR